MGRLIKTEMVHQNVEGELCLQFRALVDRQQLRVD